MLRTKLVILAILLALLIPASIAFGGNTFSGISSTADGYATWDSDMINVEQISQTGRGVYVAVLDTGLVPNWRDYFPTERIATHLGTGFEQSVAFKAFNDRCGFGTEVGPLRQTTWVGSTGSTHGTHVTSTIIGYSYRSNFDAAAGYPLPPIVVRGIAPEVTIIPVKVLADYQIPALPLCGQPAQGAVFGTNEMVAAGIDYVTGLAQAGYRPMVINMSLGGAADEPISAVEKAAIDRAIAAGVVVVAAAGNEGDAGMDAPGSYEPVISAGASGWTKEWTNPNPAISASYRLWWLQSGFYPFIDIPESTPANQVYVTDFSGRDHFGGRLDVLAPGSWVRGPFAGDPGYSHLPWWSNGIGDMVGRNPGNFYYVGGTSMATPHVASVAALMLQANPSLTPAQVEAVMKSTALPIAPGSVFVPRSGVQTWGADATGAGLIQADAAVQAVGG